MTPTKEEVAEAIVNKIDADYAPLSAWAKQAIADDIAAALRASEARAELAERQYREVWTGARTAFGADDFDACLGLVILRHAKERKELSP